VMICTGTGSAPMRAMTEYRRRLRGKFEGGRLMLFFGARTQKELPYFGPMPFPVLEGQSIGILPPGVDDRGKPHVARQYSIASPRNGERPGYNNLSLTVKRVTVDHDGNPVRGVCSNYVCDLKKGDTVKVIGPFGASFLMPNHP